MSTRQSNPKYDSDGETFCTPSQRDKMGFTFRMYNFKRVLVKGPMTSENILKTCKAKGMRPVCGSYSYSDGNCRIVTAPQVLAHPTYQRQMGLAPENMLGTYFYIAPHRMRSRSMYDNGVSYRWAIAKNLGGGKWSVSDKDGDAWCVKRSKKFNQCKTSFRQI